MYQQPTLICFIICVLLLKNIYSADFEICFSKFVFYVSSNHGSFEKADKCLQCGYTLQRQQLTRTFRCGHVVHRCCVPPEQRYCPHCLRTDD